MDFRGSISGYTVAIKKGHLCGGLFPKKPTGGSRDLGDEAAPRTAA
jgi:hypothetical protein